MLIQGYWLNILTGEQCPIVHTVKLNSIDSNVRSGSSDTIDYSNTRMYVGDDVAVRWGDLSCRVRNGAAYDEIREAILSRNDPYSEHRHWAACFVALRFEKCSNGRSIPWIVAIGATLDEMTAVE